MQERLLLLYFWIILINIFAAPNLTKKADYYIEGENNTSLKFAWIAIIPLILVAATRGNVYDSTAILYTYNRMPVSFSDIPQYLSLLSKDKAFYFCSAVIHCIFGDNRFIYFGILAIFHGFSIQKFFKKYSSNYAFSVFLFLTTGEYISFMLNSVRQFTAACITLFAAPYILSKKVFRAIIIVLLASLFHRSAILLLPMIFVVQGKAWNGKTIIYIISCLLAILFVSQFTSLLDEVIEGTQYSNYSSFAQTMRDDGTNPLRVLVYSVPAIWGFIKRREIRECDNDLINISLNMSIVSMGIYVISMVTSGIFIGRLPIYFSMYSFILLPWEIQFLEGSKYKMVLTSAFCLFSIYYFVVIGLI